MTDGNPIARGAGATRHLGRRKSLRGDEPFHGVIVVDKPAGLTSAQVVSRVRARLGVARAGHTGTLDPLATGVLPVCLGDATRLAGYLIAEDKAYRATVVFGAETDTYDAAGAVTWRDEAGARALDRARVEQALAARVGRQEQEPPMYSAIKIKGRRLHELARAGETIERPARAVTIHALALVDFAPPEIIIDVTCTKGTYIRSLAFDLGRDLGCGGHLAALRRTRTGALGIERAIPLDLVDRERARTALIPMPQVTGLPSLVVPAELERLVVNAVVLTAGALGETPGTSPFQLVGADGRLLAIAALTGDEVRYERVFKPAP